MFRVQEVTCPNVGRTYLWIIKEWSQRLAELLESLKLSKGWSRYLQVQELHLIYNISDPKYLNLSDIAVHLQSWRFNSPTAGYLQLHSFDLELLRRKKAKWKEINILLPRFGRGVSASKTDNIINQHSCESSHLIGVWSAKHIAWLSRFWNYYRYSFPVCHPALWTAFPSLASPYIWLQYTRRHLMCWMLHLEKWKWCLLLLQRRKTPSPEVGMSSTLVKSRTAVRKHHIVDNTCLQILSDIHRKTCLHHDELNRK